MQTGWKLDRVLGVRLLLLGFGSLLGLVLGVMADVVVDEPLHPPAHSVSDWLGHVLAALLLSPFTVTFTGGHTHYWVPSPYGGLFLLGGLLFWPVYALLAWRWMKTEAAWLLALLILWCVQGFFLLLHRMDVMLSV